MEDLPLGRIAAYVHEFAVKDLPLGRTLMMMMKRGRYAAQLGIYSKKLAKIQFYRIFPTATRADIRESGTQ